MYKLCVDVWDKKLGHRLCWAHAAWQAADVRGGADRGRTWQGTEIIEEAGIKSNS